MSVAMRMETAEASAFERIIGAPPIPYAISAALFATLFGPPTTIAIGLLATGSWAATVDLYFGGLPPDTLWQQVVAVLVWWLTYFVIFAAVRWERRAIARQEVDLDPIRPPGYKSHSITQSMVAFWPAAITGGALVAVSWPFVGAVVQGLGDAQAPLLKTVWIAQNLARLGLFFLGLGTLLWSSAAVLLGLIELGRRPLQLRPLEDDGLLGLRPAGSMALIVASTYFGIASLLALQLALAPSIAAFSTTLAVSLVIGVLLFFAPLWKIHRKMLAAKKRRQTDVRSRLLHLAFESKRQVEPAYGTDSPSSAGELADLRDSLGRAAEVLAIEAAGRKIDGASTWPLDLDILRRLGAVMLPIVIALLTELVGRILGL